MDADKWLPVLTDLRTQAELLLEQARQLSQRTCPVPDAVPADVVQQ